MWAKGCKLNMNYTIYWHLNSNEIRTSIRSTKPSIGNETIASNHSCNPLYALIIHTPLQTCRIKLLDNAGPPSGCPIRLTAEAYQSLQRSTKNFRSTAIYSKKIMLGLTN